MKSRVLVLAVLLLAVALAVAAVGHGSEDGRKIVKFGVMAPVTEPFTGTANPIRGVDGGGLPWEIDSATGELRADGRLKVHVKGLVLARRSPVPEGLRGTNPIPSFKAIVSCVTSQGGTATTVNLATGLVPAAAEGDAKIEAELELPSPCLAPIVFVTSPGGAWFSATGH